MNILHWTVQPLWCKAAIGTALIVGVLVRYHHYILTKNAVVTDQNRSLLVETLRSIAEILIWGDQNDSTVFE